MTACIALSGVLALERAKRAIPDPLRVVPYARVIGRAFANAFAVGRMPDMAEWIAIAVTALGVVLALVKANEANTIARDALTLTKEEHETRATERAARARLLVEVEPANHEQDYIDGVINCDATRAFVMRRIRLSNNGDRNAGATLVEVRLPAKLGTEGFSWADPRGAPNATKERPVREGDENVLQRRLTDVALNVPEELTMGIYLEPPDRGVARWAMVVRVKAESAEPVEDLRHDLAIQRYQPR